MRPFGEIIAEATDAALPVYGDSTSKAYYERLKEKKFQTTRCTDCREVTFPPRDFCPACYGKNVEWFDMPKQGTIHSFTTQHRALRFTRPDVIGLVDLAGVGRILTRFVGTYDDLRIGQKVELDFIEPMPGLVLHQFKPV